MKKFLYTALMLLSSVTLTISCGDDDDSVVLSQTPAADVQGTYTGQLVISYVDPTTQQEVVINEDATVVTLEESQYIIGITFTSTSISKTGVANISTLSGKYAYSNKSTDDANTFGAPFTGEIIGNNLTLNFSEESTVRVNGRPRKVNTTYTFSGVKEEGATKDETPASDAGVE